MNKLILAIIVLGAATLAAPAHAHYLSGYSSGGSYTSNYSRGGGYSRYYSRGGYSGGHNGGYVGASTSGAGYIERKHGASYARLRQQKRLEAKRAAIRNATPPCGNYGRLPSRCKRGLTNVAER